MTAARRALRSFIRKNHNGVVQRFAEAHGFSRPLVSMWLSGDRSPGLDNAHRLEAIAGIPAEQWMTAAARRSLA